MARHTGRMNDETLILEQMPVSRMQLRVAMVTETYPPEINGVAVTLGRMVDGLCRHGHSVQLIRPRQHAGEQPTTTGLFEEVLSRAIAIPRYASLKMGLPAKAALVRQWSLRRPDVVHIATEGPLGWSALAAAKKLKLPIVSDFHTNFHSYTQHYGVGWLKKPIAAYLRKFHNRTDATLVPTAAMQRDLTKEGYRGVQVVARGVDAALFHPGRRSDALRASWGAGPDDLVVITVGRLAPEKNLDLVFAAFDAIAAEQPRARLVLVGDGPARPQWQKQFPRHVFAGMRTGEDLASHYASGDLFLFPSLTETYGNVTTEALASGLAVTAFDYAAASELIRHGHNGHLAPFGQRDSFITQALHLARNPSLRLTFGQTGRAGVEALDWEHIISAFIQSLNSAVSQHERKSLGLDLFAAVPD